MATTMAAFNVDCTYTATRTLWDTEFDRNYSTFAHQIAVKIAHEVFFAMNQKSDPYKVVPHHKTPQTFKYSFELVDVITDIVPLIKLAGEAKKLPPFNEWFEYFSIDRIRAGDQFSEIDTDYFRRRMGLVCQTVSRELRKIFDKALEVSNKSSWKISIKNDSPYLQENRSLSVITQSESHFEVDLKITAWFKKRLDSAEIPSSILAIKQIHKSDKERWEFVCILGCLIFAAVFAGVLCNLPLKG